MIEVTFTVSAASNGQVFVGTTAVTSFTSSQLAAGQVSFVHNGGETTTASFAVSVEDGNEDGSTPPASTFNLTVTPANDPPVLTGDLAATVPEGGSYVLTASDLGFTDADDDEVTFTVSAASNGQVFVGTTAVTSFTSSQLAAGQVSFVHNGGETTTASFAVSVEDGNEDGSTPPASTFNLTVTPANDPPVLTGDLAATVPEGGSYVLTASDLGFTDADDDEVTFTVSAASNGQVFVGTTAVTSFTSSQLAAGQVSFVHNGGETTTASFAVSVEDGNEDGSTPPASTFNLTVTPANDPPVEEEPNNGTGQANVITIVNGEGAVTGTLENSGDDYFVFHIDGDVLPVNAGDKIILNLIGTADADIQLLWDDDNLNNTPELLVASGDADFISYTASASGGTYYARVFAPDSSTRQGEYTLSVDFLATTEQKPIPTRWRGERSEH